MRRLLEPLAQRGMEGAMGTDVAPTFWPIIAAAAGDKTKLAAELQKLDKSGMVRFYMDWRAAAEPLHGRRFQRDGLSDDAVDDIAQYVIQQGKAFYGDIVAHPKKHKAIDENAGSPYGSVIDRVASVVSPPLAHAESPAATQSAAPTPIKTREEARMRRESATPPRSP